MPFYREAHILLGDAQGNDAVIKLIGEERFEAAVAAFKGSSRGCHAPGGRCVNPDVCDASFNCHYELVRQR